MEMWYSYVRDLGLLFDLSSVGPAPDTDLHFNAFSGRYCLLTLRIIGRGSNWLDALTAGTAVGDT